MLPASTARSVIVTARRSPRAWGLSLSMDYQEWQADSGEESFYLASGDVIHSKLSDILLDALAINLGIDWRF